MPGKLISLDKRGQERDIFPVVNLHVFIGSDPYCDLRIKHKSILPQHCLITAQKDKPALIRSLSHTSSTLVNGTVIGTKDIELKDHDVITISHKQYKWQYDEITETPDGDFNLSTKGRKSWPLFKNKLVAVVTPHRRDEDKDLPLKKRRATFGGDKLNTTSKKGKVLGIKSGVKGSRKSTATKKSSIKISPTTTKLNLSQVPLSSRKSVKFADTVFQRQLGRRKKMSYGHSTPHRATPGEGKASLYFTPPSSGGRKPKKGILKTPVSHSKGLYSSRLPDLGKGTPPGLPETSQNLDQIEEEESGLRTPPRDISEQPEVIMRSSKRSASRSLLSPVSTPKSASKSKDRRVSDDESLEASERAAKKLKQNPPVAIDKKKMAALLQCHRKSLTPHPVVYGRGRTLLAPSSSKPVVKPTSPTTPTSIKKRGRPKKSDLTPYSKVVPKVLRFGSLGNFEGAQQKKKRKPPFQPRSLDKKYPTSRGSVAKMISSPSPPGKKMTRATRAARASREPVHKREVTDVLSALDLSRKWPTQQESAETSRKPTSPIADFTNVSGIKELFSTDKTVDVRELFLEESNRQSRRSSKSSETSESSNNLDGVELLPSSPSSQLTASTSRRSLTLKGSRTPLASPRLLNEVKKSPFKKRSFSISNQSISTPESQEFEDAEESDFSLGSFNSSKYKSRDTSLTLSPASTSQPTLGHSIANKVSRMLSNTNPMSVVKKIKKQRLSLRRMVLSSSTPKSLSTSLPDVMVTEEVPVVIDLTRDSPERSLPLKKRSLKAVTDDIQNSVDSSIVIDVDDESVISKNSVSLPSEGESSSKRVGRPSKKSKTQTANLSYVNDSQKGNASNLTDASLRVNIGSIRKNLSDNSLVSFITPAKDKLSKSVVMGNKLLPKVPSRRSSAPGKVIKVRTKNIRDQSILVKSKSTRSTSSVNIDLFGLDELPHNLPSSTPLKVNKTKNPSEELNISVVSPHIKSTRNKSEVNINLFRLGEEARNSRVNKSLNIEKVINRLKLKGKLSKSLSPQKAKDDFLQINTSQLSKSINSALNKSHISQKNMSSSNILEQSSKSITTNKLYNTSRSKSTRSTSSVTIDLFKLDDKPLDSESNRSLKYSPLNVSVNSTKSVKIEDEKGVSMSQVSALSRKGRSSLSSPEIARKSRSALPLEAAKSTRSRSSVNIDLFKLDDKRHDSVKEKSYRSKSAEGKLDKSLELLESSPRVCDNKSKKSILNTSVSSPKVSDSKSKKSMLNTNVSSPKVSDIKSKKSILNISVTSIKDRQSLSPNKRIGSNKSQIADTTLGTTKQKSSRSGSSVNIDLFKLDEKPRDYVSKSTLKDKSFRSKSAEGKLDKSLELLVSSPKVSDIKSKKSILNISVTSIKDRQSLSPNKRIGSNKSQIADTTLGTTKQKSTRSGSSVNIDLFKLDEKPRDSVSKSTLKDKSFRSKSAEGKLDKSLELLVSSPKVNDSKSEKSILNTSVSSVKDRQSLSPNKRIGSNKSQIADTTLRTTKQKSTRSGSSVNIDLFKLDEKPRDSVSKSTLKDKSFRSKSAEGKLDKSLELLVSSPKVSDSKSEKNILNTSVSSVKDRQSLSPNKRIGSNKSQIADTTLRTTKQKSTRSGSSVNIDLFKLDEKPRDSVSKSTLKDKSFRSKSAEGKLDKSLELLVSSPKVSDSKSEKSILNTSVSSVKDRQSLSPNKRIGSNKSQIADTTLRTTKQKSTRSGSSVNIDLFKLDEKPRDSVSKSTLKDKSFRSKSAEGKLDKSLELLVSSPKVSDSKSEKSILNTSVSSVKDRQSLSPNKSIGSNKSQIADTTLRTTKQKSSRSGSSVNIDLFKLDEKPRDSVSKSTLKDKSFRSKSAEGKLDKSLELLVSSPKVSDSKSEKSILNTSVSSVKDRQSLSPNKRIGSNKSQIADTTLRTTKQKSTRSGSSVNIDLFKLDEKPRDSVSKSTLKDKSFRSKSAEGKLDKSLELLVSSPKVSDSKSEKSILNTSVSSVKDRQSLSPNKRIGSNKSQIADTTLRTTKQKSTRSGSSVNIDLFKLDEKPRDSVSKSTLKDKSFRNKSAQVSSFTSPLKKAAFGGMSDSKTTQSDLRPNSEKRLMEKTLSDDSIYLQRHSRSLSVGGSPSSKRINKSERKILKESKLLDKIEDRSTRRSSSVNIDLFKLDDKSSTSTSPTSNKRKRSIVERNLDDSSISIGKVLLVASTPAVAGKKFKKSLSEISPITNLNTQVKPSRSTVTSQDKGSLILNSTKVLSNISELNKSKQINVLSHKSLKDKSLLASPKICLSSSLAGKSTSTYVGNSLDGSLKMTLPKRSLSSSIIKTQEKSKFAASSSKKSLSCKSTRLNFGLDDLCQLNESPLKRNRKSSLTPSLNSLTLSSAKIESSSVSKWKRSAKSPRVILSVLTSSEIESFKSTQTKTKTFDYKQTQTSTVKKSIKTPYAKQLGLLHKIPIVNFANVATPVDQFKTMNVISPRGRTHRTPEYSPNAKTPLSALFTKGRHSLSKQQTPVNKSKNSKRSPLSDRNQISLSLSEISPSSAKKDNKKQSIKSPVSPRSQTVKNNQNKSLVVGNQSANLDTSMKDGSKKIKQANGKIHLRQERDVSIPIQDYVVGSTMNVTPRRKSLNSPLENLEVLSSTNSKKSITKIKQKTVNKKIDSSKADEKLSTKSKSVKSPKVVALKVNKLKENKVLSSPIIKDSPLIRRTRSKLQSEPKKNTPPVPEERKTKGKPKARKLSIVYYKGKSYSPNVEISSKRSTRSNRVTGNATTKSTKEFSSTKKVLSSSIIKSSPVKGRRTRANKLQISNVSQSSSPSVQEEKKKGKIEAPKVKAGKSSRAIKGKQVLVKSPKADISTKRHTRRNKVTVKSPEQETKNSAKSSTGKKKLGKLPSPIAKEAVKPISRVQRNTVNTKSTPIEQPTTSKAKAVKTLQPSTVQESKINSPVIIKIGKRGRGAKSPVKEEKSVKFLVSPVVEHEQPPQANKLATKKGRPPKIDKLLIISPILHGRRLEKVIISPLQMKVEKAKISPSKISSLAVRRGRTAKSKVSDSNISKAKDSSFLKIKSSSKKEETKQKPNLKTVMKATKSNSSTKIKKIIKTSASSLNEITKNKSLPQKGNATKRSVEEKKSRKSLDTMVKDQGSPVAKRRGRPAKSSGEKDKPLTPVVKLGRRAKPIENRKATKRKSLVEENKSTKSLLTSVKEQESPVAKRGRPAKSSGKKDNPLTPVVKLGRRAKPIEKGKATKRKSLVEENKSTKSLVTSVKEQESPVAKRGRPAKSSGKKDKPLTPVVKLGMRAKPIEKGKATKKTQKK